ncbi:MAG: hypothetical protein WEB87_02585, partial [Bacteriovoracaceae bacterium]
MSAQNHLKLKGIEFTEFSSEDPQSLHELFLAFGFSRLMRHKEKKIDLYLQNDIVFLLNYEPQSFGTDFYKQHGPCVSSMGWRVEDGNYALEKGVERGAKNAQEKIDYISDGKDIPAIYGIGDSLIYLIDNFEDDNRYQKMGFEALSNPDKVPSMGFEFVDHLTNNVEDGTMKKWSDFYKDVFGFTEVRYFDIKGAKTG